ncbi:MAG: acetyl-CoA carboxylase carboxyltransferase subunit alpha [Bacteroidales bacterium]|nr:acetyl-CoA carboxylase carboxyltransferase subunit alpha [Bacteroidales bacterium]
MELLPFEEPIGEILEQIEKAKQIAEKSDVDVSQMLIDLDTKLAEKQKEIYENLSPWQRVQISRHPNRPYTLQYINAITEGNFIEQYGDRLVKDDKAMVGGFGSVNGRTVMFIGQQKGINTKMRQFRNFGMANPSGYRKALRLMRLAEKFNKPIVTLVDTPGAYPGIIAEEQGQAEAIAKNMYEMFGLKVPIITIIIGEGASGGAIGIGIGDKVMMLENTWYSVISPESCSSILWRNWEHKEEAANALKLTPVDMKEQGLIDSIIPEPTGGAHAYPEKAYEAVKKAIIENLENLDKLSVQERIKKRTEKFSKMGTIIEA